MTIPGTPDDRELCPLSKSASSLIPHEEQVKKLENLLETLHAIEFPSI